MICLSLAQKILKNFKLGLFFSDSLWNELFGSRMRIKLEWIGLFCIPNVVMLHNFLLIVDFLIEFFIFCEHSFIAN